MNFKQSTDPGRGVVTEAILEKKLTGFEPMPPRYRLGAVSKLIGETGH